MATLKGGKVASGIKGARIKVITFSGTVTKDAAGVARTIYGYRKGFPEVLFTTESESDGSWSLDVLGGGSNDSFRVLCLGADGENSEIYEHLVD